MPNQTTLPIRQRLKTDLLAARKARQKHIVTAVSTLLTAIDNAEAVELDDAVEIVYGGSNDVPRKNLTQSDIQQILRAEVADLQDALAEYQQLGQQAKVEQLQLELDVMQTYLQEIS